MGIITLARAYDQVTIINTKLNTKIKKAQGNATYAGTQINYEDRDGEVRSEKIAQSWLDNDYQAELKQAIANLKPGDQVTLYKERTADEDKYNGITDPDAKKKAGYWGVKKIYPGHVIPDEMKSQQGSSTGSNQTGGKRSGSNVGMKVGHSIKGATTLCYRLKKPFSDGAKEVYDVTDALTKEYASKLGLSEYDTGQTVGNAVLNACFLMSPKSKATLEQVTRKILDEYLPDITAYIAEKENPKPVEPEQSQDPESSDNTGDDFDDSDIPF
jgi:hypothetical protein